MEKWGHIPHVVDADALRAVSSEGSQNEIVTPHARELEYILNRPVSNDIWQRSKVIKEFTETEYTGTVLLKGYVDVIGQQGNIRHNVSGHPSMSKGGTGDLLAGLTAGLLSRGVEPFDAACVAAHIMGRAGEETAHRYGETYTLEELAQRIPNVINGSKQL